MCENKLFYRCYIITSETRRVVPVGSRNQNKKLKEQQTIKF